MATQEEKKEYQLVVFNIGAEEFGVDIVQVREIVRLVDITPMPKAPKFIEGVINLRGQILAVVDLAKRLGIVSRPRGESTRIVVIEIDENIVGMVVDSVSEVLRISAKDIEEVPDLIDTEVPEHYIRGVGKIEDRLLVFLDLSHVLTHEEVIRVENHVKTAADKDKKEK